MQGAVEQSDVGRTPDNTTLQYKPIRIGHHARKVLSKSAMLFACGNISDN